MATPHGKRLTDVDRSSATARLRDAFVEGTLSHEEFENRIEAVLTAVTTDDIASILGDVPMAASAQSRVRLAVSAGHVDRIGLWQVPREIVLELDRATSILDFRAPTLPDGGVTVHIQAVHGRISLLVRRRQHVVYDNLGRHHSRLVDRMKNTGAYDQDLPVIELSGDLRNSSLRVLPPRRSLFWR